MNAFFQRLVSTQLVYTFAWEDPELDQIALQLTPTDRVVMIAAGGCNVFNYYLAGARSIAAVDLNPCQTALLEMKLAAATTLIHPDFFALFGTGIHPGFRKLYTAKLRPRLSPVAQNFWDHHQSTFDRGLWRQGLHQRSTSGLAYKILHQVLRLAPGLNSGIDRLYSCNTLEEQREAYRTLNLRKRLDSPIFRWLLRRSTLMDLMAIPREQFAQIETRYPGGMPAFALDCIENVFTRSLLKDNYFWQAARFGRFTPDCCPSYLREENFNALAGISTAVTIHTATLTSFLANANRTFDKYILLDHMDWLGQTHKADLTQEWNAILRTASPKARIIFRTGGPDAGYLNGLPVTVNNRPSHLQHCLDFNLPLAAELHRQDRTCIYGNFYICTPRHAHEAAA